MKYFYKIEGKDIQYRTDPEDGFIEYDPENPPQAILDFNNSLVSIADISEAKKLLSDTDWITAKMIEAYATGGESLMSELRVKYSDIIKERENARLFINEHE